VLLSVYLGLSASAVVSPDLLYSGCQAVRAWPMPGREGRGRRVPVRPATSVQAGAPTGCDGARNAGYVGARAGSGGAERAPGSPRAHPIPPGGANGTEQLRRRARGPWPEWHPARIGPRTGGATPTPPRDARRGAGGRDQSRRAPAWVKRRRDRATARALSRSGSDAGPGGGPPAAGPASPAPRGGRRGERPLRQGSSASLHPRIRARPDAGSRATRLGDMLPLFNGSVCRREGLAKSMGRSSEGWSPRAPAPFGGRDKVLVPVECPGGRSGYAA
jgi:hypothetical protein